MATIIIKNSTGSGAVPSSLTQGELAINVVDGKLFYGSGSGNVVKEFRTETGSFATTGSNTFNGNQIINGNVTVTGTASINTLVVNQTVLSTGSNQLGDAANDTQTLFGTVRIPTGSLTVTGSVTISGSSPSLQLGTSNNVGDFTNPTITFGSTSNGIYLDSSRLFFKAGGVFSGAFTSDGYVTNQIQIKGALINDLTTAMFIPYRLNAIGLSSGLGGNDTGAVTLITSGSTRLYVSSSGFVGIGTTTPTYALDVTSPTGATAARFFGAGGTATVAIGANGFLTSQASQYRIYSAGATPLTLGSYGTYGDLWIINGNIGVGQGTTSPTLTSRFTVRGSGATSSTTALRVENTNASASLVVRDDSSTLFAGSNGTSAGTWVDATGSLSIIRGSFGTTYGLRVYNGAGWSGHNAIQAIAYQYPIYGAQGSNGVAEASPLNAGAGVYGQGGVGVHGRGITPTGDTGSIGVMATSLYVHSSSNTALYNRSASVHILASDTSSNFSFLVQNSSSQTLFSAQNNRTVNINSTNAADGDTTIGTTSGTITFNRGYNNTLLRNALTFYGGGDISTIQGWSSPTSGVAVGYAQTNTNPVTGSVFTVKGTATTSGSGVLFVTGSSATRLLTIASETSSSILVVSGSGNIGVGTNNPSANIHIVNSSSAAFRLQNVGGSSADFSISAGNSRFELVGNGASSGRITILQGAKYVGINQQTPTAAFHIVGAGATSATTALLVQNSTPTNIITVLDNGTVGIRRAPTSSLDIAGTTRISGSFNTAISGAILTVIGSGSTQPIFTVQGSQGELFSINDSLSGSLFSVNDISGLPILEVFSDSTTLIGDYQDPMLITTKKVTMTNSGSFVVYSLPTSSYDTAFFDYSIKSGSNARAGQIMAIQSGSSVNFTETTTTDFGNTTAVSFTVIVSGSNMVLTGSAATGSWTIKSIIRGI
jgi:fibronectin-binding autotransporter adhesin